MYTIVIFNILLSEERKCKSDEEQLQYNIQLLAGRRMKREMKKMYQDF